MPAVTAASLDAYFRKHRSPLAGYGAAFIRAGQRYGFDPRLLVAISGAESSLGVHAQGHNPFGWGPGIHFGSWRQAIDRVAQGLKAGYLDQGLRTPEQIQQKWAPQHVANDPTGLNANWLKNVQSYLKELGGADAATGSPTSSTSGADAGTLAAGPDLTGFASSQLQEAAAGHRYNAVQQLTDLTQLIRSTPEVEPKQASQSTGLTFEITGAASELDKKAVGLAQQYLGDPYVWGGSRPGAFDCSGLLQYVWGKLGVNIPRTTYQQINAGRAVALNQLRPGDAIFFGTRANPHHVGMYIGGGRFIEAPHTGANVRISSLKGRRDIVAARRYA
jgi:cell wall-associated NlpC family hydrolase